MADSSKEFSPPPGPLSAEICTVGTELLLGQTIDTNAAAIAQQLALLGIDVYYRSGVGDNISRLQAVIRTALSRADAVILTGGLGPTQDDVTTEAIADLFQLSLVEHEETAVRIRERVARLGLKVADTVRKMALIPEGAEALPNFNGQAAGIWLEREGKLVIALPGVPSEMKEMLTREVAPRLRALTTRSPSVLRSRVLRLVGIAESLAEERVRDLIEGQSNPTIAPYAGMGEVKLRITARAPDELAAEALIAKMESAVRERLGAHVYGVDNETLEQVVGQRLLQKGLTIATAESCTAGLLSAALTEMPGSSGYLIGGEIVYSNQVKEQRLGVPAEILAAHGAVSAETAAAMAAGVRSIYGTDLGVSVTGIAGPGGGTPEKPVGLVFFGFAGPTGAHTERRTFGGSRSDVRRRSVLAALQLILLHA